MVYWCVGDGWHQREVLHEREATGIGEKVVCRWRISYYLFVT